MTQGHQSAPVAKKQLWVGHMRVGDDWFPILFPVILGALIWGGLFFRDRCVRALLPWRSLRDAP
jgi:hypothetical protein